MAYKPNKPKTNRCRSVGCLELVRSVRRADLTRNHEIGLWRRSKRAKCHKKWHEMTSPLRYMSTHESHSAAACRASSRDQIFRNCALLLVAISVVLTLLRTGRFEQTGIFAEKNGDTAQVSEVKLSHPILHQHPAGELPRKERRSRSGAANC